jgi:glycosyltransferase involved in cell wall biosynthesis
MKTCTRRSRPPSGYIVPSASVLREAAQRGYSPCDWQVVPNPLLVDPDDVRRPGPEQREQLRLHGPVRAVARLGAEKGVTTLLATPSPMPGRPVEVVLASAGFEATRGGQSALLAECQALAAATGATLLPPLGWREVPQFLAGAAVTIVPSARETFGNLALESLSAGTPVIAHATGNLPALIGPDAGILVPPGEGPAGLLKAAGNLLADPLRYRQACGAAYCRSRNYRSANVAETFLKAVA